MRALFSAEHKVVLERKLWIAVMRAQRELGVEVPDSALASAEAVVDRVDLASIRAREKITRHDVKARLEEFCHLAGHEHFHKGMTSRDLTENVEQMQFRAGLVIVRGRMVAALARLAELAVAHESRVLTARSHNVPAQATTLGKRFANAGEELLSALRRIESFLSLYPLRGLKGPVGTEQDQLDLLGGDTDKLARLEEAVARHLGFAEDPHQRRPGLPAVARFRDGERSLPGGVRAVELGHHPAPHGRPRAGYRRLPKGPSGLVGHAAQDEQPFVRAHHRLPPHRRGLRHHGERHRRRPVERGGRELLGGAARGIARRIFRDRRLLSNALARARGVRRVPRGHRARAPALPALSRHDQGADGRGTGRRGARARSRGHQGARGGGGARNARTRRGEERPSSPPPHRPAPFRRWPGGLAASARQPHRVDRRRRAANARVRGRGGRFRYGVTPKTRAIGRSPCSNCRSRPSRTRRSTGRRAIQWSRRNRRRRSGR